MFNPMGQSNPQDLGNGGTIDGDLVVSGDLTVNGGGSLSFDEIIEGTQVIDVTSTEALLIRKNGDGGDVLTIDTTNARMLFGGEIRLYDKDGDGTFGGRIRYDNSDNELRIEANEVSGDDIIIKSNDAISLEDSSNYLLYLDGGNAGINTSAFSTYDNIGTGNTGNQLLISSAAGGDPATIQIAKHSGSDNMGNETIGKLSFLSYPATTAVATAEIVASTPSGDGDASEGILDFYTNTSSTSTKRMTIDNSGNVGIGTTTFNNERLHIHRASSSGAFMRFSNTDSETGVNDGLVIGQDNSENCQIWNYENGSVYFGTNGTLRMVIDNNSRISLSNNDSAGTGGSDSTSGVTLLGYGAGNNIASGGVDNSFFGHGTGNRNTTGEKNSCFGNLAGFGNATGDHNTYVGYGSGWGVANNNNSNNTGVGFESLKAITTGGSNVAVGYEAADLITTGSNNTVIGDSAEVSANSASNQTVVGQGATGQADNSVTLGNASVTKVYMSSDGDAEMYANGTINTSDRRLKEDINDTDLGLSFINALRPVSYKFIDDKKPEKLKYGIIAQEVQEVLKESGNEDFAGITDKGDYLGADYVQFIAPLIKAVQELSAKIEELEKKL